VLCSSQDHIRTGTCDPDNTVSYQCKNTDSWCTRKGDLQCIFARDILMVPSFAIVVVADGERLACCGFSLSKTICLGNFEFIVDYLGGLSLSPRRGNIDATFMGSTHSGAPTPRWAMIEDSVEEFLMVSSGEGSFYLPSRRRRGTGGFTRSRHNHTKDGELSVRSGHDDGSPADGGAVAINWPPFRAMPRSSQGGGRGSRCKQTATVVQPHTVVAQAHT
jgi:hypothetical protein